MIAASNKIMSTFLTDCETKKLTMKKVNKLWQSDDHQAKVMKILARTLEPKQKKALSAYNVYLRERYASVKRENKKLDNGQIMKLISSLWKDLSEEDQQVYKDEADKLRAKMPSKKGSRKKPGQPTGASNSFIWFSKTERPKIKQEHPDWESGQVTIELGPRWDRLSDKMRAKYDKLAKKDMSRWKKEMKEWKEKKESSDNSDSSDSSDSSDNNDSSDNSDNSDNSDSSDSSDSGDSGGSSDGSSGDNRDDKDKTDLNQGFLNFCENKRAPFKSDNSSKKAIEITMLLKKAWAELDDEEQEMWAIGNGRDIRN